MSAPTISSERVVNEEGSDFVTVTVTWPAEWPDAAPLVERHSFAHYFDDGPGPSAVEQAASFVAALEEAEAYSLEERLGPYGLEWEREQEERWGL